MPDVSDYTIEFRVFAATRWRETDGSNAAMRQVKDKLRDRYNVEPPRGSVIKSWSEKLFATGSICDKRRSGRPGPDGDTVERVEQSLIDTPQLSTRIRSSQLDVRRNSLMRIQKNLGYKPFKLTKVQYLSFEDHLSRVELCQQILNRYPNAS